MWKVYELQTAFYTGTEHAEDTVHCHRRRKSWFPNPMKYFAKQDWILRSGTFMECLMERERERETSRSFSVAVKLGLNSQSVDTSTLPIIWLQLQWMMCHYRMLCLACSVLYVRLGLLGLFFFLSDHKFTSICYSLSPFELWWYDF